MTTDAKEPTVKLILGAGAVLATPLFVGATLAGAVGSAAPSPSPTRAAAGTESGGLSLTPSIAEWQATIGASTVVTVANTTRHGVHVTLRPRPWLQATDGTVSPDPHRTLSRLIRVSPSDFTMAAGTRRTVRLTLRRRAPGSSLYGALDLSGVPPGVRSPDGIMPRYRLIGSLRLNPATTRTDVRVGPARVTGRSGRLAIVIPLRNLGNTVEPISGRVVLSGPRSERLNVLDPVRVVPRRLIWMTLGTDRGLLRDQPAGRYRLSITLSQAGHTVLRATRTMRLT